MGYDGKMITGSEDTSVYFLVLAIDTTDAVPLLFVIKFIAD